MNSLLLFFCIILGAPCGAGIALYIMAKKLDESNNFGDSKGELTTFTPTGLQGKDFKDRVKKDTPLEGIRNPVILAHRATGQPVQYPSMNPPQYVNRQN